MMMMKVAGDCDYSVEKCAEHSGKLEQTPDSLAEVQVAMET